MQSSHTKKIFSQVFFAFSNFRFNFQHFQKESDLHSVCIIELTDSEKRG